MTNKLETKDSLEEKEVFLKGKITKNRKKDGNTIVTVEIILTDATECIITIRNNKKTLVITNLPSTSLY